MKVYLLYECHEGEPIGEALAVTTDPNKLEAMYNAVSHDYKIDALIFKELELYE